MLKKLFISLILLLSLSTATLVYAKVLPRFAGSSTKSTGGGVAYSGVGASVRFNGARNGISIYLSNLNKASSVTYMLSYQSNGKDEGAMGTIYVSGENSATRELLFGTCSSGVCTYHTGITDAKLEITTELTSGKKTLRRFKLKV
jgi:hypothetical protein